MFKRRFLYSMLSIMLMVTMFAGVTTTAYALTIVENGIVFDTGQAMITGYEGSETTLIIPSKIQDITVRKIGEAAFAGCNSLKSITIPSSVMSIATGTALVGDTSGAFTACLSLEAINVDPSNPSYSSIDGVLFDKYDQTFSLIQYPVSKSDASYSVPSGVTEIYFRAFEQCDKLSSVTIPGSVTNIYDWAFNGCDSLSSVTISDGVKEIGYYSFGDCLSLSSVFIPNSVNSINCKTFANCVNLTIYGNQGSYAQMYAEMYRIPFMAVDAPAPAPAPPPQAGTFPANKIPAKVNVSTVIAIVPPAAPRGYSLVSVTYSSSNPSVAAVDASGNASFLAGGKASIITKSIYQMTDSKGKVKTKIATVKRTVTVIQPVASIALNVGDTTIARTQKVKLTPAFDPATASNKKVKWTSDNPKVAAVSSTGVVTGKAGGTAVITCIAKDGSGASASCTVTVTPVYPAGLRLSKAALTIKTGKSSLLKATVLPKYTDFKAVTWASSDPSIVSVDAKGKVVGVAPGMAIITATSANGLTASCTVTVS